MKEEDETDEFFANMKELSKVYVKSFVADKDAKNPSIYQEIADLEKRYKDFDYFNKGGMKFIFSAIDSKTDRQVAVAKLIDKTDPEKFERFFKEARITAALEHPNIMPVYDVDIDDNGEPFFVMKKIDGINLKEYFKKGEHDPISLMQILIKICDAIDYTHSKNIIHLDLKPDNIQIGNFGEVLVIDWGIARVQGAAENSLSFSNPEVFENQTVDGFIQGSLGYLAPEQIDKSFGQKDTRTDIYGLGGILYFLLIGKAPVSGSDMNSSLKNTLAGKIEPPSSSHQVPQGLEAVCMKALSTDQNKRYQTVNEFKQEINQWLKGFATKAEEAGFLKSVGLLYKRHQKESLILLIALLLVAGFFMKSYIAEKSAFKNLQLLVSERKKKEKVTQEKVSGLLILHNKVFEEKDIPKAMDYLNEALQHSPDNLEILKQKSRLHFICQEFDKVIDIYKKNHFDANGLNMKLSEKFVGFEKTNGLLEPKDFEQLLHDISSFRKKSIMMTHYAKTQASNLKFGLQIAEAYTRVTNPQIKELSCKFEIDSEDKIHLDLSGNKKLSTIEGFENIPVAFLDISNTRISSTDSILTMPLIELNINDSKILSLRSLIKIKSLKKLSLSQFQFNAQKLKKEQAFKIYVDGKEVLFEK